MADKKKEIDGIPIVARIKTPDGVILIPKADEDHVYIPCSFHDGKYSEAYYLAIEKRLFAYGEVQE